MFPLSEQILIFVASSLFEVFSVLSIVHLSQSKMQIEDKIHASKFKPQCCLNEYNKGLNTSIIFLGWGGGGRHIFSHSYFRVRLLVWFEYSYGLNTNI